MTDFTNLTDAELWQKVNDCALRVSFFEAAEGNWSAEADARSRAHHAFREAKDALAARGVKWENTQGYLV